MVSRPVVRLRPLGLLFAAAMAFAAVAMFAAPTADAGVAVKKFEATPSTTQAGGHPDVVITFENESRADPYIPDSCNCNGVRDAKVSLPAGFIGNPHATPQCSSLEFALARCPVDSQVGTSFAKVLLYEECCFSFKTALFNIEPGPGQAGLLGFKAILFNFPIYTVLSARTGGDFGLNAKVTGIGQAFGLTEYSQKLWGVPADPSHDSERYGPSVTGFLGEPPNVSNSPLTPFLQNPTRCAGPQESQIELTAYDHGVTYGSAPWPATTGCDQLDFKPSLSAVPSTRQTDSPTGLDVDLAVPQVLSPSTPSDSQIREAEITLPKGFSINPNAADGKEFCTDVQAKLGTEDAAACPEFAKVGTVSLTSTALPGPVPGGIYLGEPKPGDPYRLILVADGYATHIKLPGSVKADPESGQLVTSFKNLPQSPFSRFTMHFFGSERGFLATPSQCGTYAVQSRFVSWNSVQPDQDSTQFFTLDSGPGGSPCPGAARAFNPRLSASTASNDAGTHSPFSLELTRRDGDQLLKSLSVKTPPGFSATLKGVPYCSEAALAAVAGTSRDGRAELAASACPAGSQIGSAVAGVGAGSRPVYLPGKVYLAGPHKGAPLSLAVITPAVSGPYDLGNVVVRAALNVNRSSAQVTAVSDPFPQIFEGIPLRLRSVRINLDRPRFTLNPTNCDPFAVTSLIDGTEGAQANTSNGFQAANCAVLPFAPKFKAKLKGGMKRSGHPALTATISPGSATDANIARAVVTLPHSEFLDNAHLNAPCTRVQFAADACPPRSVIGGASVKTPLLDQPLRGSVYLRSSSNKLPDLVMDLKGQLNIELVGRIDSINSRLRATFENVPDAPISEVAVNLYGGKKGLLVNSTDLCDKTQRVNVKMFGQNGRASVANPVLTPDCGKQARNKRTSKNQRVVGK